MSLRDMTVVPGDLLEKRITDVKTLEATQLEQYSIVKDEETGEHYLHYRYIHRDVAAGGAETSYHQLMPLTTDEVLSLMFNDEPYRYPDAWRRPFLRNGPNEEYIWFDPAPAFETEEAEREAARIKEALLAFKRKGNFAPEEVERFLRELDEGNDSKT